MAESKARELLRRYGNLRTLGEASPAEIADQMTLDPFESLRAQALLEIGRRMGNAGKGPLTTIDDAEDIVSLLKDVWAQMMDDLWGERREHFFAILLDSKNNVIRRAEIHVGTLNMSLVGTREVFREAIRDGASSVVVVHNHPSGDPTPSPEDLEVTRELVKVGRLLDIPVLDHIILGERDFRSLQRMRAM